MRQAFRKYLECGIFAHGFARARCDDCGHDYFVVFSLRRRILRAFVGRGLLESFEAQEMLGYQHNGFSVDAGVCIETHDRALWQDPQAAAWLREFRRR